MAGVLVTKFFCLPPLTRADAAPRGLPASNYMVVITSVLRAVLRDCEHRSQSSRMNRKPKTMSPIRLIWLPDAPAEYSYLSLRKLRQLVLDRDIRSWRVGRKVYLAREDLESVPVEVPARSSSVPRKRRP